MPKELIGYVPVDSGQLMVADPAYLKKFTQDDYEDCVRLTTSRGTPAGETFTKGLGRIPLGVVSLTKGDGKFPVYIYRNDKGEIISITVDLDP